MRINTGVLKPFRWVIYLLLTIGASWALAGVFARKDYLLVRQTTIAAPLDLVYDQVRYFRNFRVWSPWADMEATVTIEGEDGSPGAVYTWAGDGEVGQGRLVLKALSPQRIDFEVSTEKPYRSTSPTWFIFETDGELTTVKWFFHIHIGYPWNGLAMFTDVDAGVGKDLAHGLENLKRHCEIMMPRMYDGYAVYEEALQEQHFAGIRRTIPLEQVSSFLSEHFETLDRLAKRRRLVPLGPKTALFWAIDSLSRQADVAAAVPVSPDQKVPSSLQVLRLEGGVSCRIEQHAQPDLNTARQAIIRYLDEKGRVPLPPLQVEYMAYLPETPDTAQWVTHIRYRAAVPPPEPIDTLEEERIEEKEHR